MDVLAALDIGNSRVSVGIFDGERLCVAFSLTTDVRRTAGEYGLLLGGLLADEGIRRDQVEAVAIASVVPPLTEAFEQVSTRLFGVQALTVGAGTRTGIRVATHNPREVGTDRVVNAVAAHHLYGGPAIVVDCSTATAFDVVGEDGSYLGSALAPGLAVAAEALFQQASRLHRVDLAIPRSVVGKDTTSALQSGLLFGHVALVEGMIARIQREQGWRGTVVATGELASLIAPEVVGIDHLEPNLTLIGLRVLHEMNEPLATSYQPLASGDARGGKRAPGMQSRQPLGKRNEADRRPLATNS
jgi:type III pantothenate kinase